MHFGYKHVETYQNCSHQLTAFLKYHMLLNSFLNSYIAVMQVEFKFKEFEILLWKIDGFDCAGIRARVFRLPVDCSDQVNYTSVRNLHLYRKTSLYRLMALPYSCINFKSDV